MMSVGPRPYSAGDGVRRGLVDVDPPPPPIRRDSSLERGIIGAPPPLVRDSDRTFTAAEVERLLAVREKERLAVKGRLHRASKRCDTLESTTSVLKQEALDLRSTVEEHVAERDALQLRVSDLEETVKRKANALKNANRRREQAQEAATSETAQAWRAAQLARGALEEAGRKRDSFREHARDAEARVKGLELKLEVSKAQAADAKQAASMELVARASAQERVCAEMKATVASAEKEQGLLRAKLEEALEGLWQKREAERETDKVIRELQAWRERVACGDVVEMSPSEVKRLRWSEEQGELLQEANATIRNQLLESGRLLAEAEHSFGIVTAGFEDAGTTITGLSVGLEKKKKELQEVEMALRASKSEASRLKKCVTSLQLRLSEQHRRLRGKERVLESTQKGMEALVRGRQKEIEARSREAVKRRDVEKVAANAAEEKALLQRRVEDAAERSRELYAERHVLLEHVAAARRDAASARSERTGLITSSRRVVLRHVPVKTWRMLSKSRTTSHPTIEASAYPLPVLPTLNQGPAPAPASAAHPTREWQRATRSLLERAVSDWSVKVMVRSASTSVPDDDEEGNTCMNPKASCQKPRDSSVVSSSGACSRKSPPSKKAFAVETPVKCPVGLVVGGGAAGRNSGQNEVGFRQKNPVEVVRVYRAPNGEETSRTAGWRWDLVLAAGAGDGRDGTRETMAVLGLDTLGQSLRERGVRGEGARMALTAVARLLGALRLTRHLAAQQCAEVRTELALALGRLSCRAMLVSDTRAAARRTSICNRTLLLRLVRSEMRLWRLRAAAAATEQSAREKEVLRTALTERGRPFFPPGEGDANPSTTYDKHPTNVCRSPDAESAAFTVNWGTDSEIEAAGDGEEEREDEEEDDDDDYGDGEEIERSIGGRGERRSRMQPKGNEGTGVERAKRKKRPAGAGFHLNLSGFDLDDETLHQVVRKLLRQCTDRSRAWPGAGAMYEQQGGAGEDGRNGQNTLSSSAIMPLRCLLLRGNNLTDAGALALVPLVEASSSLAAIDLRGNRIGTKGELALKKALTRSPWVYRVTSEEASGSDAREGSISTGGVVLRAKRRPMSTVRDRARAHAFKRIPPSNKTIPGKATIRPSPCSAGDDQPGEYHAGNDDGGRAPAHGSSIGCRQDENNDGQGASRQNCGSNLTPPTDMERLINTPIAASPICTIDLRGCSRRPLPLPLAAVGDFEQGERLSPQKPYPTVEGSPSEQQRHGCGGVGRGSDRHQAGDAETCVNQNTSSVPRRVHAASTSRGQDGQVTRLMRTGLAANLMGSSSRRPRYTGRRKPASRGEDCVFAPKSEAQELEDLTSLLSISRRIFSRAEGFEETHNLPEERRTQGATRAPRSPSSENGKRPDSSGTEPDTSKSGLPGTALVAGLGRSHSTNAPEETDKCGQMPSSAGKGDTTASTKAARAERPHDSREAAIEGEGYPADSAAPSGEAPPASVSATHPRDMQCDDRTPEVPTTAKTYPHEENRVVITGNPFPAEDFDAIACRSTDDPPHEPAAASPPPRAYPAICADARQTTSTTTEGESHYLEGAEKDADVDDAASAGDVQYSTYQNGEDGWIYDEATAAWYAVDPLSYGTAAEGLGDSGGGWRYDEQREAWYQDGPQESSCVLVPTPTHVDTENTGEKDHGATGEDRSGSRWRGSRRIPGRSLEALGSGVREKDAVRSTGMVESDASGAGGLIEKRIEALELALQDKGRPNDAWRDRKRAPP